jgi:6-phosphogluconolactonase
MSFEREADGSLREGHTFANDGRRTGGVTDPLESQGSLTLRQDHSLLFAVNGSTGEIPVFLVGGSNLLLLGKVSSGGAEPNAVAQHGHLVYVLNVVGSSNVADSRSKQNSSFVSSVQTRP